MIHSIDSTESGPVVVPAALAALEERRKGRVPVLRQLAVVTEMIQSVDTLTTAGQRHTMSKVTDFLEQQIRRLYPGRGRPAIYRSLEHLVHEATRTIPDARAFRRRAEMLVSVIAAAND